jgi:tetratricopeptide (TPR) repeat protein
MDSIPLPPAMAEVQNKTADELAQEFNRIPLFMTHLPEADGDNVALDGIKALVYEGTRLQVATNFRNQGNDFARSKNWKDAKESYSKALAALDGPQEDAEIEIDKVKEAQEEKALREICLVNRALSHLELSMSSEPKLLMTENFRSCILDCAATLRMNQRNIKAWFRSASACLALDKTADAQDACERGLEVDSTNASLLGIKGRIAKRQQDLDRAKALQEQRREKEAREQGALSKAFKQRKVHARKTNKPPDMDDALPKLSDPTDPSSTLSVPVLFLYPLAEQTDLIKQFEETHSLNDHLSYILPLPWDKNNEYVQEAVDCYIATPAKGLVKAGKKLPLSKIFDSGKIEIVDGMLQVYIVPSSRAQSWIATYKERVGRE